MENSRRVAWRGWRDASMRYVRNKERPFTHTCCTCHGPPVTKAAQLSLHFTSAALAWAVSPAAMRETHRTPPGRRAGRRWLFAAPGAVPQCPREALAFHVVRMLACWPSSVRAST